MIPNIKKIKKPQEHSKEFATNILTKRIKIIYKKNVHNLVGVTNILKMDMYIYCIYIYQLKREVLEKEKLHGMI